MYNIKNAGEIATPALIYYKKLIIKNIEETIKLSGSPEQLRPHVKSHKTLQIPLIMMGYGVKKFKAATIAEAEMLAIGGIEDVLLAYPPVGANIKRFADLIRKYPETHFQTIVDSSSLASQLNNALNSPVKVMLDIDCGMHRTGVSFEDAFNLYKDVSSLPNVIVAGLHIYDGHNNSTDYDKRSELCRQIYDSAMELKAKITSLGSDIQEVVMGGSPTFAIYAKYPDIVVSPGTTFLYDAGYKKKYQELPFTPAAVVMSRAVSSNSHDIITFDCGYKSIASDPPESSRGEFVDADLEHLFQSEEHWTVRNKGKKINVGNHKFIIPTHICPTSSLYDEALVIVDGEIKEVWEIASRKRTITI